jgi:hypothetical protein
MFSIDELQAFTKARVTPQDQLKAFQEGLNDLRRTHPDRWVLYTAHWDEAGGRYEFVVHGVYEAMKEAVDSTLHLSPEERGARTLISTRVPKPGIRIGSAAG